MKRAGRFYIVSLNGASVDLCDRVGLFFYILQDYNHKL